MQKLNAKTLKLTAEHVARVARRFDHPTFPEGAVMATVADHEATMRELKAGAPPSGDVWIFAYGSLIWNPGFEFVEQRVGVLRGWRRAFCLGWDRWFRGCDEHPGLMLSLDRGGQCKGMAYRLAPDAVEANLMRLSERELRMRPSAHRPRWVNVATGDGPLRAITFAIDRNGGRYVSGLSTAEIADVLAAAVGHRGSMAEYLHNTVSHLEDLGIHDRHLWELQEMVAERIEARAAREAAIAEAAPKGWAGDGA